MVARLLLVLLALACAVLGVQGVQQAAGCDDALKAARALGRGDVVAARTVRRRAEERCREPRDRAQVVIALGGRGHGDEALRLARAMVRAAPDDYLGWLAVGRLSQGRDPAAARAALRRAHELNPRGVPAPVAG
jgi:hypothetical protein